MSTVLKFVAWALKQAWRYGVSKISKAVSWAKANYKTVLRWIEAGISFSTILQWIFNILGIG